MKWKYIPQPKGKTNPNKWISGPDPIDHDKYYAWQKHRAQARFRKEEYALSWEDWQLLWREVAGQVSGRTFADGRRLERVTNSALTKLQPFIDQ